MVLIKKFNKRKYHKAIAKDISMSINDSEETVPLIPIKPAKKIYKKNKLSGPAKLSILIIFLLAIYGYIYFYIGSLVFKYEELNHIYRMTENMKKRITRLFEIEINITV